HAMLPEALHGETADGGETTRLFNACLTPRSYKRAATKPQPVGGVSPGSPAAGSLSAADAAGTLINGLSKQVAHELDEFVTSSVRNTLVGLPLDLPAINIARGRSEGIPGLNEVRKQLYAQTP